MERWGFRPSRCTLGCPSSGLGNRSSAGLFGRVCGASQTDGGQDASATEPSQQGPGKPPSVSQLAVKQHDERGPGGVEAEDLIDPAVQRVAQRIGGSPDVVVAEAEAELGIAQFPLIEVDRYAGERAAGAQGRGPAL